MDRQTKNGKIGHRRGGIFSVLACVLFVLTLTGLILRLCSDTGLEGALAKTGKKLRDRESDSLFLLSAVKGGKISFSGDGLKAEWNGDFSEEGYTLTAKEGETDFGFFAGGDRITASGSLFPQGAAYASRSGAAFSLADSPLDREAVSPEHRAFFQMLLALSDPALSSSDELGSALEHIVKKAKPAITKEEGDLKAEGRRVDVMQYVYRLDSQALVRACGAFLKMGQKEEVQEAVLSRYALLISACGKKLTAEDRSAVLSFLKGEGKDFEAFSNLLGKSDSVLEIRFSVFDGCVIGIRTDLSLGEYRQSAEVFLGEDPATAKHSNFTFVLNRDEEELFKIQLAHGITDDSEAAFIREWTWSLSDHIGFFPEGENEKDGTLRYSWGRSKGDLGLKWMQGEETLVLRGTLLSYKEEKHLRLHLNRIEENGTNLLPCDSVEIELDQKSRLAPAPEAKQKLFARGEKKESFGQAFEDAYNAVFGGVAR